MAWDDLLGERELKAIRIDVRHPFDPDSSGVAFELGDFTVFVFEDPSDGYRSCAVEPMIVHSPMYAFGCDPDYIRVPVTVSRWEKGAGDDYEPDGIQMKDRRNGKVILTLGTSNSDDYYPSFVCDWQPENIAGNAASD